MILIHTLAVWLVRSLIGTTGTTISSQQNENNNNKVLKGYAITGGEKTC